MSSRYGNIAEHEAHVLLRWLARSLTSNAVAPLRRHSKRHLFTREASLAAVECAFGAPQGLAATRRVTHRVAFTDAQLVALLQPHTFTRARRDSKGVVNRIVFFYDISVRWRRREDKHSEELLGVTTVRVSLSQVVWEPSFIEHPHPTEFPTHGYFIAHDVLTDAQRNAIDNTPRQLESFLA